MSLQNVKRSRRIIISDTNRRRGYESTSERKSRNRESSSIPETSVEILIFESQKQSMFTILILFCRFKCRYFKDISCNYNVLSPLIKFFYTFSSTKIMYNFFNKEDYI